MKPGFSHLKINGLFEDDSFAFGAFRPIFSRCETC